MARRHRQVVDLYTSGRVVELVDGSPVWLQALNPFEQDSARNEAQIARARLTLALKEFGTDEHTKVRLFFFEDGPEEARNKLIDAKVAEAIPKVVDSLRNDPEWKEKLQVLERGLDETAKPMEHIEQEIFNKISKDYATEVGLRISSEREYTQARYVGASDEDIWRDYLDWYTERRVNEVMMAEFRLHQMYFATRVCNGTNHGEGTWTHENCDGHTERLFASKDEARTAPEGLQETLLEGLDALEFTVREAKNSHRQGSFSDSSPLPDEVGESTVSTPTATRAEHLGTSSSLSPML